MNDCFETGMLFPSKRSVIYKYIEKERYPWMILSCLKDIILEIGKALPSEEYEKRDGNIYISKSSKISSDAQIEGPVIICPNVEIRKDAFIRGSAVIGCGCVVGNSTEIKNSVLFDESKVPHYNYVGDSILGFGAHLGAGVILSNLKSNKSEVVVQLPNGYVKSGLKKLGAIIGDNCEIGCNSVLNPGTIIEKNTDIYPLSSVRGFVCGNSIYKSNNNVILKK